MTEHNHPEIPHSKIFLNIGSLVFEITSLKYSIIQEYDPAYKQFLIPEPKPGGKTVPVQILLQIDLPDLASLAKIFDTFQSWSMYAGRHDKFIAFHPSDIHKPEWIARINADLHSVKVYCKENTDSTELNPVRYPLDQLLLINLLIGKGLLIHAAGLVINGRGYLFAGHSGSGKSTICGLFQNTNCSTMLSDDRIVVEKSGQDFLMFGTPWPGDAGIAVNGSARLHGIFFLNHAADNSIKKLSPGESLKYLFKVASLPWYDKNDLQKSLDLCDELLKEVKTYELNFRPEPEIVEAILSFVSG